MSRRVVMALVAVFLILVIAAGGLWLLVRGSDAEKGTARSEVQQYYDARHIGEAEVKSCAFRQSSGDFECSIVITCRQRVTFAVPRAAPQSERKDAEPVPADSYSARPACAAGLG